jgi:hypothetical protein
MLIPWRGTLPLLFAISLSACTTASAPEHQSQRDPNTNISAWSTFGWKPAAGEGASDQPMRMLDVNIRNAIVAELTRRGYKEVDTDPQFLVTYEIAAQDKVKSSPFQIGIGMGSWGGSGGGGVSVGSPSVQSYQEGRLIVHAIDAAANKEVWNGTVTGRVDNQSAEPEAVARVVAIAMQDFPIKGTAP